MDNDSEGKGYFVCHKCGDEILGKEVAWLDDDKVTCKKCCTEEDYNGKNDNRTSAD